MVQSKVATSCNQAEAGASRFRILVNEGRRLLFRGLIQPNPLGFSRYFLQLCEYVSNFRWIHLHSLTGPSRAHPITNLGWPSWADMQMSFKTVKDLSQIGSENLITTVQIMFKFLSHSITIIVWLYRMYIFAGTQNTCLNDSLKNHILYAHPRWHFVSR